MRRLEEAVKDLQPQLGRTAGLAAHVASDTSSRCDGGPSARRCSMSRRIVFREFCASEQFVTTTWKTNTFLARAASRVSSGSRDTRLAEI